MSHPDQDSGSQNWTTLRRQLASFRRGKILAPTQILEMKEGILQLRDAVIQSADVLVATPYAACEEYLCRVFKPTHIVVDEANQISEPRLWPLLASYTHANNEQFKAMVLIGDQEQLPPTVMARKDKCFFRDQLQMSLFTRMQKNGLSLPALCQQRRMHRDIADCPRTLSYGDRLATHLSTRHMVNLSTRHFVNKGALHVRRLNAALFKIHSNLVVIDNKSGRQQKDPATGSSFNEENVQVVIALVEKLLTSEAAGGPAIQPDRICVLTFYAAQEELIWEEMHRLRRAKPQLRVQAINVSTVDRYQGNESDIVILDMVVDSLGARSFVEEAGRLNSALTRARHGLYVIALCVDTSNPFLDRRVQRSYLFSVMWRWNCQKVICQPRFVLKHLEAWNAQKDDVAGPKR
ncbi:hypothetical protein N7528_006799 [Penicillium herquei]|nr:hypothetical protein N7528_006799 [Penicillium herquei]